MTTPLTQSDLELKMATLGESGTRERFAKQVARGNFSRTRIGAQVRDSVYQRFLNTMEYCLGEGDEMRKRCSIFAREGASVELIAAAGLCGAMDSIVSRKTFAAACGSVGARIDDETRFTQFEHQHPEYWLEVERSFRGNKRQGRRTLRKYSTLFLGIEGASAKDRSKAGLFVLMTVMKATDIFELEKVVVNGRFERMIVPTDKMQKWVGKALELECKNHPHYLPFVEAPRDWTSPFDGGHHTTAINTTPLMERRTLAYLKEIAKTDLGAVFDAVNTMQRTCWEINKDLLKMASQMYNSGADFGGCKSPPVRGERDSLEPTDDIMERRRRRRRIWRRARDRRTMKCKRLAWARLVATARIVEGNQLYFPTHLDFRGRLHPRASRLTPNGDDLAISLLQFSEGQLLRDDRDWHWVESHGFNLFAPFKGTFDDRREWVQKNLREIEASAADPFGCRWWSQADKPMSFLAWAKNYADCRGNRRELWKMPVMIDGSNNGLQIFSFLLRDPVGGAATNCLPCEQPADIYQDIADEGVRLLRRSTDPFATRWLAALKNEIPRAAAKPIGRDLAYGVTKWTCLQNLITWWEDVASKDAGDPFIDEPAKACAFLTEILWEAANGIIVGARVGTDWLQGCADVLSKHQVDATWTTPAGLKVVNRYRAFEGRRTIKMSFGGKLQMVGYGLQNAIVDGRHQRQGLPANIVQSIEAAILMLTIDKCRAGGCRQFRTAHDSYGSLPRHMDLISRSVRETYLEVFQNDLLAQYRSGWQASLPEAVLLPPSPVLGGMDVGSVIDSKYFFS